MCMLMLRGPQTVGELRGRTDRLYDFSGLDEVKQALGSLMAKEPQALVARLSRQLGQKEVRYTHLLAGEASIGHQPEGESAEAKMTSNPESTDRLMRLEREVASLRAEVQKLRQEFSEF